MNSLKNTENPRVSRRNFIKYFGTLAGGLLIGSISGISFINRFDNTDGDSMGYSCTRSSCHSIGNTAYEHGNPSVLLVLVSFHHHNTEKVAKAMANILDATIKTPEEVSPDDLLSYDLVGFGSGIYGSTHHKDILDLANSIPLIQGKDAFIFSTCSLSWEKEKNHKKLREILQSKGFHVIDEYSCPGYNTNSFIKYVGGLNKGRPNSNDLLNAENFALNIRTDLLEGIR